MSDSTKNTSHHQKQQGIPNSPLTPEQLQRVELLKLQKELQRREKEREAWREASTPRNVFTENRKNVTDDRSEPGFGSTTIESLFFAKLRLGKLLE